MCVCVCGGGGGGGSKAYLLAGDNWVGCGGMLPRQNFTLKSSEMARNAKNGQHCCKLYQLKYVKYVFFSFEVRSLLHWPLDFDQHNRLMRQKFLTHFLVKASSL